MDNLILIGAGGHAKACIDIIEQNKTYKIAGIINNDTSSQVIKFGYKIRLLLVIASKSLKH